VDGAAAARAGALSLLRRSRREITDEANLERIASLVIPPAWRDVWISPSPTANLQATGFDAAGRKQYLYHRDFRAAQEEAKFDKLIRFAEALPAFREAMAEHIELDPMAPEWTCAVAVRLINLAWFRVGEERYAKVRKTFGITTLRKSHVSVRGSRIAFRFRGKHRIWVRTAVVDSELADAMKVLLEALGGRRLFRYRFDDEQYNLSGRRLNEYTSEFMGDEFTAKEVARSRTFGRGICASSVRPISGSIVRSRHS
jgi:DNA topoisomerase-1